MKSDRAARRAAYLLLALGLCARLWKASRSRISVVDDAFYYFGIARHLALGDPPSIDGVNATNGYHPLWMAILVPVHWIAPADDLFLPVQAAVVIGGVLDVLAAFVLFRVCLRLRIETWPAVVALAAFLANRYHVLNATSGLETPLALLLALTLLLVHLRAETRPWQFGVVAGLCVLARLDLAIIVVCLLAARALTARREHGRRAALGWLAVGGGVTLAALLPWLLVSWITTGTVVQSSGVALSVINDRMPAVWGIVEPGLTLRAERVLASMGEASSMLVVACGAVPLAVTAAVLAASIAWSPPVLRRALLDRLLALSPWLVALALLFVANAGARTVFREWYTAPYVATFAIVVGVLARQLADWLPGPRMLAVAAVLGSAVWATFTVRAWSTLSLYHQGYFELPSGSKRVGFSDTGVEAYFATRGVTNLDGVVNHAALDAIRRGELLSYLREQDFEVVYLRAQLHSSAFLGPRYREQLVTSPDPAGVRVVRSESEKDELIGPTPTELPLEEPAGREYLSDGWSWTFPVRSVGHASEILLFLPEPPGRHTALLLRLRAVEIDPRGIQVVRVTLDGRTLTTLLVTRETRVHRVPLASAAPGRNRIRLEYAAARSRRNADLGPTWWRDADGHPVQAVEADSLHLNP